MDRVMPYILDKPVDSGTPSSDYSLDAPRVFESFSKADPFLFYPLVSSCSPAIQ
jgi:hypothetical protein